MTISFATLSMEAGFIPPICLGQKWYAQLFTFPQDFFFQICKKKIEKKQALVFVLSTANIRPV